MNAFPDTESVVMDWVAENFPAATVISVGAPEGDAWDPLVRVLGTGGIDDRITDYPLVDVDTFSRDRQTAYDLCEAIRARLLEFPHRVSGALIDRVQTNRRPSRGPWQDENVHRYMASYVLSIRR